MNDYVEDFIFTERLKGELQYLRTHPEVIKELTPVLCFYGYAGVGKTSFAKLLLDELCGEANVFYHPMNEGMLKANFLEQKIEPLFRRNLGQLLLDGEYKPLATGVILDEFHNLTRKEQDRFKVKFDDVLQSPCIDVVIMCCNIEPPESKVKKYHLSQVLTEPILSRVHRINFNPMPGRLDEEYNELRDKAIKKYPLLCPVMLKTWLPDFRRIVREGKMSELRTN